MKKNQNDINITDNIYYICRTILIIGLPLTIISGLVLSHLSFHSSARISSSDSLSISVPSSCTLSSSVDEAHSASIINGTYESEIGKTTLTTFCNDRNGYNIYSTGYTLNNEGNNVLASTINSGYDITSGTATSGTTSSWAMKLSTTSQGDDTPTITPDYNNQYGIVPTYWTKVASKSSGTTNMTSGSSFSTTYAVYISPTQPADTYTGQVKYIMIHSTSPSVPFYIMQEVANWKDDLEEGESIQALDSRDSKLYWVTKLADGHVWMTQNLDFDIVADEQDPTKMKTLTSEDTDLIDHSLTGAYSQDNGYSYDENTGTTSWTPVTTAKTMNFRDTTVNGWQNSPNIPYSASKIDDDSIGHASLGNYYNWTAAIASNDSSALTRITYYDITDNPQNSICPRGWRLPTISNQSGEITNSTNEFARLNFLYNNNKTDTDTGLINSPVYLNLAGYIYPNLLNITQVGRYSSSSVSTGSELYHLSFSSSLVETSRTGGNTRSAGFSIRCVAR